MVDEFTYYLVGSFFLGVGISVGGQLLGLRSQLVVAAWPRWHTCQMDVDGNDTGFPRESLKETKMRKQNLLRIFLGDWSFRKIGSSTWRWFLPRSFWRPNEMMVNFASCLWIRQGNLLTFRFKVLGACGLQSIETVLGFCFPNMTWCPGHAMWMIDDYSVLVHVLMLPLQ